jgi:serine/threonine-protein kinase TTK/MPS1
MSNSIHQHHEERAKSPLNLGTPVPPPRTVRITAEGSEQHERSVESSGRASSRLASANTSQVEDGDLPDDPATIARPQSVIGQGSVSRYGSSAFGRSRYGEETGIQSSLRVKRAGKVAGSFLSGPARRGRRRQSEEDQSPQENAENQEYGSQEHQEIQKPLQEQQFGQDFERSTFHNSQARDYSSGSPLGTQDNERPTSGGSPTPNIESRVLSSLSGKLSIRRSSPQQVQPVFKVPPRPELLASHDQENEPPPTFKRNRFSPSPLYQKAVSVPVRTQTEAPNIVRATMSPDRPALAPRSQNTPRRPAPPPPPKMSVLETATASAGAATSSHANKKRNIVKIKNKVFTRMDLLGRGGSSRVYRVMAENYKVFALKKVNLEEAEESAVRGYKGEIDLLRKLEGVDRVVRLYDYEINEEKGTLSVVGLCKL